MPNTITVTCRLVDTCYPDFVPDSRWIGVQLAGQTREEMAEQAAEEFYSYAYNEDDTDDTDYPIGDYAFGAIKQAALDAIKVGARFWPVDEHGTEITDPDGMVCPDCHNVARLEGDTIAKCHECGGTGKVPVPDEQPSAWFVFDVEVSPMRIKLTNSDDDDGSVLVTCDDPKACDDDGYIDGSSWETPSDMDEGYTILTDRPSLVEDLEKEGYDVDASEYSPPTAEDLARWEAKYKADGGV